jgi:hypothetical protein
MLDLNSALLRAYGSRTRILQAKFYPVRASAQIVTLPQIQQEREKENRVRMDSVFFLAPPARLEPNDNVRAQAALTNEVAGDLTHNPPSAEMELWHKTKQKSQNKKQVL